MEISYHGHSVVKIQSNGKTILIDPFINGNGLTDLKVTNEAPDIILLTHGHNDHVGDTVELAKKKDALVIAPNELANWISWQGVRAHPMHIGGAGSSVPSTTSSQFTIVNRSCIFKNGSSFCC